MSEYKVISVDMFQTLVDVSSRRYEVFKRILGDSCRKEFADECWTEANRILSECIDRYIRNGEAFYTIKEIFTRCYQVLFPEKGIKLDPAKRNYFCYINNIRRNKE